MQFIALATDYDATLATEGRVDPQTMAALDRFKRSGRRLVMVTGRELSGLRKVFDRFDLFDRIVAENGALLHRPDSRESVPLGDPPPPEFIERLKRAAIPLSIGRSIVATVEPHEKLVLDAIRDLGLELQIIFNKGAVMVLPAGVNKASGLAAGLNELGLSPHNVAGIGDAENDHAFLRLCGASAAVANALPSLKEECDMVTRGNCGAGVVELIDRILENDLKSLRRPRHQVALAETPDGEAVPIEPGSVLLTAGSTGGSKSTFLMGLMERLWRRRYQYCAIDPEGDFEHVEGAVVLGTAERPPRPVEIMEVLNGVHDSVVVNLAGLDLADRGAFLAELFPHLTELRSRTSRPHWIILDEAYHLLPASHNPTASALPDRVSGLIMATVEPAQIAPAALRHVEEILLMGKHPRSAAEEFRRAVGDTSAPPQFGDDLQEGMGLLWRVRDGATRVLRLIAPQELRRSP